MVEFLQGFLKIIFVLICVIMTFFILLQEGKGGGLAGLGGTKAAGVEGVTNPIRRATAYLAILFFILAGLLAFLARPKGIAKDKLFDNTAELKAKAEREKKAEEEAKKVEETQKAEAAKKAEEAKKGDEGKKADEAKKTDEAKKADEAKKPDEGKKPESTGPADGKKDPESGKK